MENQNEVGFDLLQMVRYLLRRVWIILLVTAVFATAGYAVSKKTTVPQYTSTCRIFVSPGVASSSSAQDYYDILIAMYLKNDCSTMITGRNVSEQVVEELKLNMSPEAISGGLKVTSESDSRILDIQYTDTNPKRAQLILNKVNEIATEQIMSKLDVETVSHIYDADLPTVPSENTITRDALLAGAVGLLLSAAVLIVLFLMDDTIRNEDDVDRYLGLSTLSTIPVSTDLATDGKINDKRKKKGQVWLRKK